MAFNVSGLTDYTRAYEGKLVTSIVYAPRTAKVIEAIGNVQVGITEAGTIDSDQGEYNILDNLDIGVGPSVP